MEEQSRPWLQERVPSWSSTSSCSNIPLNVSRSVVGTRETTAVTEQLFRCEQQLWKHEPQLHIWRTSDGACRRLPGVVLSVRSPPICSGQQPFEAKDRKQVWHVLVRKKESRGRWRWHEKWIVPWKLWCSTAIRHYAWRKLRSSSSTSQRDWWLHCGIISTWWHLRRRWQCVEQS